MLSASRDVYGSGAAYAADFNQVLDALQGLTGATDALTNSFVAQQLQQPTAPLADAINVVPAKVAALGREVQTRAMAA